MKYLIIVLMACVGCAYGYAPEQQSDNASQQPWDTAPIPNPNLQAPQQPAPQPNWGDECIVAYATKGEVYTCAIGDHDPPYYTVTGAPCSLQQCIVGDPCYVIAKDGGTIIGTCSNH